MSSTQVALVVALVSFGCSSTDSGSRGTGGSDSAGGGAGSSSKTGGKGGGDTGVSGGGPNTASGGTGGSKATGGAGGTVIQGTGGLGQTGGTGGTGGTVVSPAVPSAGCGKAGRPAGGEIVVANDHIYNFPATYDGNTPMPLLFGLHGANNANTVMQGLTKNSRLETNFVRAFPKSNSTAWVYGPADNDRITAIYNDLLTNYCIDKSRIFITGHSSGAQMVTKMLCQGEKRFKAVAPVAAGKSCDKFSPVPVMYIQGIMDAQRGNGNGADVVAMFTASNLCSTETKPDTEVPTCNSTFDKMPVTPGCVTYQKCSVPTIWCSHNDNGYNLSDGRMHGWPCFANNAMSDFFLGLP